MPIFLLLILLLPFTLSFNTFNYPLPSIKDNFNQHLCQPISLIKKIHLNLTTYKPSHKFKHFTSLFQRPYFHKNNKILYPYDLNDYDIRDRRILRSKELPLDIFGHKIIKFLDCKSFLLNKFRVNITNPSKRLTININGIEMNSPDLKLLKPSQTQFRVLPQTKYYLELSLLKSKQIEVDTDSFYIFGTISQENRSLQQKVWQISLLTKCSDKYLKINYINHTNSISVTNIFDQTLTIILEIDKNQRLEKDQLQFLGNRANKLFYKKYLNPSNKFNITSTAQLLQLHLPFYNLQFTVPFYKNQRIAFPSFVLTSKQESIYVSLSSYIDKFGESVQIIGEGCVKGSLMRSDKIQVGVYVYRSKEEGVRKIIVKSNKEEYTIYYAQFKDLFTIGDHKFSNIHQPKRKSTPFSITSKLPLPVQLTYLRLSNQEFNQQANQEKLVIFVFYPQVPTSELLIQPNNNQKQTNRSSYTKYAYIQANQHMVILMQWIMYQGVLQCAYDLGNKRNEKPDIEYLQMRKCDNLTIQLSHFKPLEHTQHTIILFNNNPSIYKLSRSAFLNSSLIVVQTVQLYTRSHSISANSMSLLQNQIIISAYEYLVLKVSCFVQNNGEYRVNLLKTQKGVTVVNLRVFDQPIIMSPKEFLNYQANRNHKLIIQLKSNYSTKVSNVLFNSTQVTYISTDSKLIFIYKYEFEKRKQDELGIKYGKKVIIANVIFAIGIQRQLKIQLQQQENIKLNIIQNYPPQQTLPYHISIHIASAYPTPINSFIQYLPSNNSTQLHNYCNDNLEFLKIAEDQLSLSQTRHGNCFLGIKEYFLTSIKLKQNDGNKKRIKECFSFLLKKYLKPLTFALQVPNCFLQQRIIVDPQSSVYNLSISGVTDCKISISVVNDYGVGIKEFEIKTKKERISYERIEHQKYVQVLLYNEGKGSLQVNIQNKQYIIEQGKSCIYKAQKFEDKVIIDSYFFHYQIPLNRTTNSSTFYTNLNLQIYILLTLLSIYFIFEFYKIVAIDRDNIDLELVKLKSRFGQRKKLRQGKFKMYDFKEMMSEEYQKSLKDISIITPSNTSESQINKLDNSSDQKLSSGQQLEAGEKEKVYSVFGFGKYQLEQSQKDYEQLQMENNFYDYFQPRNDKRNRNKYSFDTQSSKEQTFSSQGSQKQMNTSKHLHFVAKKP